MIVDHQLLSNGLVRILDLRCKSTGLRLSAALCMNVRLEALLRRHTLCGRLGPDGEALRHLASVPVTKACRDAAGVNEEVELDTSEDGDPL